MLNTLISKISQKRIAGTQWQECQSRDVLLSAPCGERVGKESIDDLVRRSISTHREEFPVTPAVRIASDPSRITLRVGFNNFKRESTRPEAIQCRADKLARLAAPRGRIDDR